jgi:hypothetical protein
MAPPHEHKIFHITGHVGRHFGTCYPHMSLRSFTLLHMLVIIFGTCYPPHEPKIFHITRRVGHRFGTCYPPHDIKIFHVTEHVGHRFGTWHPHTKIPGGRGSLIPGGCGNLKLGSPGTQYQILSLPSFLEHGRFAWDRPEASWDPWRLKRYQTPSSVMSQFDTGFPGNPVSNWGFGRRWDGVDATRGFDKGYFPGIWYRVPREPIIKSLYIPSACLIPFFQERRFGTCYPPHEHEGLRVT